MTDTSILGPWIRRFLLLYLVSERNLARSTQLSSRDTLCLLLPFVASKMRKEVDQLAVIDVSADMVRMFLHDLEEVRKCGTATRNQRLAAIHSLARYIGLHSPEHVVWYGHIRAVPPKRAPRSCITLPGKNGDGRSVGCTRQVHCTRSP
jgi:site-specific recombinase XerD